MNDSAGRSGQVSSARQLGAALRTLQQRSGRTLRALEEEVCISDSSLSRYFRGDTVPPWPMVRDLCRALGADPSEYRALWEAAARNRPEAPPPVETPSAPPPRRAHTWFAGRWGFLTAGVAAGVLTGLALAWTVGAPAESTRRGSSPDTRLDAPDAPGSEADGSPGTTPRPADGPRIFVSRATGSCLDDSLDHGLRTYKCNGMSYQWWTVQAYADGTRRLRNHATGECLADGAAGLRTRPCGESAAQRWAFVAGTDEAVGLRNRSTGRCLDDSSAGLRARTCDDSSRQKWA